LRRLVIFWPRDSCVQESDDGLNGALRETDDGELPVGMIPF